MGNVQKCPKQTPLIDRRTVNASPQSQKSKREEIFSLVAEASALLTFPGSEDHDLRVASSHETNSDNDKVQSWGAIPGAITSRKVTEPDTDRTTSHHSETRGEISQSPHRAAETPEETTLTSEATV